MVNIVCDFDSTIANVELLELIAEISLTDNPKKKKLLAQIKQITEKGMRGEIPFNESLSSRLKILAFKQSILEPIIRAVKQELSTSFIDNLDIIKQQANFYIVSGGFSNIIIPVLKDIIPKENIFANTLFFDKDGNYIEIDQANPLAFDKGKVEVVRGLNLTAPTIVVGDGVSDLQIKLAGLANKFFYYNEFVNRPEVSSKADRVIDSFTNLAEIIASYY